MVMQVLRTLKFHRKILSLTVINYDAIEDTIASSINFVFGKNYPTDSNSNNKFTVM